MNMMLESNPEFGKIIKRISGIFLIFLLVMNVFMFLLNDRIYEENRKIVLSKVGSIRVDDKKLEEEIIASLMETKDEKNILRGMEILNRYGYYSNYSERSLYSSILGKFCIGINMLIIGLFICCSVSIRNVLKTMYSFIKKLTYNAERIVEGNFNVAISNEKEGDISKLSFQFNQMSKRLKRTLDQLRGEKAFLKDMISNISHQLKTPLASLKMFNELLLEGAVDEKEVAQEFLNRNAIQIDRMEWLIQSLLKITRLETGVIELNKKEYNLSVTIVNEVNSLMFNAKNKNQELELEYKDDYIFLEHDRRWLGEAVRNIIKNSIDYTPENGKIKIDMEERESLIRIQIEDNGIGIHEKDIPKIFDRFYQGKNTHRNNEKRNGTGIGLSLSKIIVEKHGGYIEVESKLGEGSRFIIIFPKR